MNEKQIENAEFREAMRAVDDYGNYHSKGEMQKSIIDKHYSERALLKVEKYKIDKMIESGLIKEQSAETISKNKIMDYTYELLKGGKPYFILFFLLMLYNSSRYWAYLFAQLEGK